MDVILLLLRSFFKPEEAGAMRAAPVPFALMFLAGLVLASFYYHSQLAIKDDLIKGYQERLHDLEPHNKYQKYSDNDLIREALRVSSNIRVLSNAERLKSSLPFGQTREQWNKQITDEFKFEQQMSIKYGECCASEAVALRDELESRLPSTMAAKYDRGMYEWPTLIGFDYTATDLERLAKALERPEPSCFWSSWIPVSLGISIPWMLLLILRASLARRNIILDSNIIF